MQTLFYAIYGVLTNRHGHPLLCLSDKSNHIQMRKQQLPSAVDWEMPSWKMKLELMMEYFYIQERSLASKEFLL